jgi:hypothetical protein
MRSNTKTFIKQKAPFGMTSTGFWDAPLLVTEVAGIAQTTDAHLLSLPFQCQQ